MDKKTISRDETPVAYEVSGKGPTVILVTGAMATGAMDAPLAALLADRFSAVAYDRRGRGASGDTLPFAAAREVEDIAALIDYDIFHMATNCAGTCSSPPTTR
ncbi:hypothetical protein GCM10023080_007580 [Streptomyces pseudoechinosporeus]